MFSVFPPFWLKVYLQSSSSVALREVRNSSHSVPSHVLARLTSLSVHRPTHSSSLNMSQSDNAAPSAANMSTETGFVKLDGAQLFTKTWIVDLSLAEFNSSPPLVQSPCYCLFTGLASTSSDMIMYSLTSLNKGSRRLHGINVVSDGVRLKRVTGARPVERTKL